MQHKQTKQPRVKFVNIEQWEDESCRYTKFEQSVGSNDVLVITLKSNRADAKDDRI